MTVSDANSGAPISRRDVRAFARGRFLLSVPAIVSLIEIVMQRCVNPTRIGAFRAHAHAQRRKTRRSASIEPPQLRKRNHVGTAGECRRSTGKLTGGGRARAGWDRGPHAHPGLRKAPDRLYRSIRPGGGGESRRDAAADEEMNLTTSKSTGSAGTAFCDLYRLMARRRSRIESVGTIDYSRHMFSR